MYDELDIHKLPELMSRKIRFHVSFIIILLSNLLFGFAIWFLTICFGRQNRKRSRILAQRCTWCARISSICAQSLWRWRMATWVCWNRSVSRTPSWATSNSSSRSSLKRAFSIERQSHPPPSMTSRRRCRRISRPFVWWSLNLVLFANTSFFHREFSHAECRSLLFFLPLFLSRILCSCFTQHNHRVSRWSSRWFTWRVIRQIFVSHILYGNHR